MSMPLIRPVLALALSVGALHAFRSSNTPDDPCSHIPLAAEIGAQKVITIEDLSGLMAVFHQSGIYTIARIVVFKDNLLAAGRPALAIRTSGGTVFHDREHLAWVNPYSRDVWAYNIALAVEAARAGFDEIQFDYTRLPDARGLVYDMPWTEANRTAAVNGFLLEVGRALAPSNHFRPWLQAFRDYAFGGHPFTAVEMKAQINAATAAGSDGWMLWNPRNRYSADGLEPRQACAGR